MCLAQTSYNSSNMLPISEVALSVSLSKIVLYGGGPGLLVVPTRLLVSRLSCLLDYALVVARAICIL